MSAQRLRPLTRRLLWIATLALGLYASGIYIQIARLQSGIDFYHFWGISAARALADEDLGTPYANGPRYAAILNQRADASEDTHLRRANQERRTIDPTGTPFFYLTFAPLPSDYTRAHMIFRAVQFACLCAGITWFAWLLGCELALALVFSFATAACFYPFQTDMLVGNINTVQLLACTGLVALGRRLRQQARSRPAEVVLMACALAAFLLYKPNLAPIALALALFLWRVAGSRLFGLALLVAAGLALALIAVSSAYFGTARTWLDWYDFVHGANAAKIAAYSVEDGNYAPSVVFVEPGRSQISYAVSLALATALGLSWIAAAWIGRSARAARARLLDACADPDLMVVAGLVVTLGASPLVWFHYTVLATLPCVWAVLASPRAGPRVLIGAAAYLGYGCLFAPQIDALGLKVQSYQPYLVASLWVPLWAAVLWQVARPESDAAQSH